MARLSRTLCLLVALSASIWAADSFVSAEVLQIDSLTHDVKRVRVRLPSDYSFQPGQFTLIRVPAKFVQAWNKKYRTSHGEVRRPYSFASSPGRLPIADFIIKLVPPPQGKDVPPGLCSTWMHQDLKPGDHVDIGKPLGALWVSSDSKSPIVLVAGGIGVAPFVSLLEHWFEIGLNESRPIHLFMGVRQRRDLILDAQLAEWARGKRNFHYIRALSHAGPEDQWTGETGFISAAVDRHFAGVLDADAFVSGSPVMIRVTEKVLNGKGVPDQRIRHDPIDVQ